MDKQVRIYENAAIFSKIAAQTEEIINFVLYEESTSSESIKTSSLDSLSEYLPEIGREAESKLKSLFKDLPALAVSQKDSWFLIDLLKRCPVKKLFIAVNSIKEHLSDIAVDREGAKVIRFLALNLPRRDKKWLFSLLSNHFSFLVFQKEGSKLLTDILEDAQSNEILDALIKFILTNICSLVSHENAIKVLTASLKHMRGEQVAKFLGKFIEINFSKLINNAQTIEFVIKLLELRNEKVFEIQTDFVNLINKNMLDPKVSHIISRLVPKLKEEEVHLLFVLARTDIRNSKFKNKK